VNDRTADLTCPESKSCYAMVGFAGYDSIYRSADHGAKWNAVPGGGFVTPCSGGQTCTQNSELDGLSCVRGTTACMVVAHNGSGYLQIATTTSRGSRFVQLAHIPRVRTAFQFYVACGTARSCMVADWEQRLVLVTADGGRNWTTRHLPSTATQITNLTCAGPHFCAALVRPAYEPASLFVASTENSGTSWTYSRLPTPNPSIGPTQEMSPILECVSTSECFAVLASGLGTEIYLRTSTPGSWIPSLIL
jgi:hypothetical protein